MGRTHAHNGDASAPVRVGAVVDGYRVDRIVSVRSGVHTLAAATAPGGERVMLKLPAQEARGGKLGRRGRRAQRCLEDAPPNAVTLAERLREGRLQPERAVALLTQVADALETARDPHRDLTPSAIVVGPADSSGAMLVDLGGLPDVPACELYAAVEDVDYRSPEQIRGEPATSASNVYSLACILVACVTGEPPYPYDRPLLTIHAHLTASPPVPSERNPELTPEFDAVIADAMSKDPDRRHHTPRAFMRAARLALEIPEPAPAPSPPRRHFKPRPKAPRRSSRERPAGLAPVVTEPPRAPAHKPEAPSRKAPKAPATKQTPAHRRRERPAKARQVSPPPVPEKDSQEAQPKPRRGRRLAPYWIGLALLASALAGFAAGNTGTDDSTPALTAAGTPDTNVQAAPTVSPVIERLDARRTVARRRLGAARRPAAQARAAADLATIYRDARRSLLREADRDGATRELARRLHAVEIAYLGLAGAARRHQAAAWRAASGEVRQAERDLELLLRTGSWS